MTIKKTVPMPCVRFAALILRSFPRFSEYRIPRRPVRRALRLYKLRAITGGAHPPIDEASAARPAESSLSTGRTSSLAVSMPLQPPSKEGDGSLRMPYQMSFLPAPRNCADNGTDVAAKARVKSCAPCLSTRLMILASKKLSVFGDVMNRAFQSLRKAFPRLKKIFNRTNSHTQIRERYLIAPFSHDVVSAVAAFRSSRTSGYEEGMVARTASDAASVRRQGAGFFDRRRPSQTIPALPRKLNREPGDARGRRPCRDVLLPNC